MDQIVHSDPAVVEGTVAVATIATPIARPSRQVRPYPREEGSGESDLRPSDRRRLLQAEALRTARELHAAPLLSERIDIYNRRGKHIVNLAAALYPELMPRLNDEFEHLELPRADHD